MEFEMKYLLLPVLFILFSTPAFSKGDAKKGLAMYNTMCVACHQVDGKGLPGLGPRLNTPELLFMASDKFFKDTILEGRPGTGMMSYKMIPNVAAAADDLVAYFRSWESKYTNYKTVKVDWKKKFKGNAVKGKAAFRNFCASCHGPNGGGYADGGSGLAIGLPGFLKVASDDFILKTMEAGRAGTAMKPFGHGKGLAALTVTEMKDVVVYLRSLEK